ncbi:hypothetical protein SDC9_173450 [bioreactor metagenome]|uniref:Uncharacterized protein n=1 Tax=bioreactor metagenome TaxID=1076179 RepID=A0A645GGI3_9ZZZZ
MIFFIFFVSTRFTPDIRARAKYCPLFTLRSMLLRISSSGAPTADDASETVNMVSSVWNILPSNPEAERYLFTASTGSKSSDALKIHNFDRPRLFLLYLISMNIDNYYLLTEASFSTGIGLSEIKTDIGRSLFLPAITLYISLF